jgi:hypothetical protein
MAVASWSDGPRITKYCTTSVCTESREPSSFPVTEIKASLFKSDRHRSDRTGPIFARTCQRGKNMLKYLFLLAGNGLSHEIAVAKSHKTKLKTECILFCF